MEILRRIFNFFNKDEETHTQHTEIKPVASPTPLEEPVSQPAPDAPEPTDNDADEATDFDPEYIKFRAACEWIYSKDAIDGTCSYGSAKVPMPIILIAGLDSEEADKCTRSYKGVLLTDSGLKFVNKADQIGPVDIRQFFYTENEGAYTPNGVKAAAFEYIFYNEDKTYRYLINIQPRAYISPKNSFLAFRTSTLSLNDPSESITLHNLYDSNENDDVESNITSHITRLRLSAYSKTFNKEELSDAEKAAVGRKSHFNDFENAPKHGPRAAGRSAFSNLYHSLTSKVATKDDINNSLKMSNELFYHFQKRGNLDRAAYFARVSQWLLEQAEPDRLTNEEKESIHRLCAPNTAIDAWRTLKPTRLGIMLYHLHSLVPGDINSMIVTGADGSTVKIDGPEAWEFNIIDAAKQMGSFTAFIDVEHSSIIPLYAVYNDEENEVTVYLSENSTFESSNPHDFVEFRFSALNFYTKEEFNADREESSNEYLEGKEQPFFKTMTLGLRENAHKQMCRALIAINEEWLGEALYRLALCAQAWSKAEAGMSPANKHDNFLLNELATTTANVLIHLGLHTSALGLVGGSDNPIAISEILTAYTELRDPRLDNAANLLLSRQEKALLDLNNRDTDGDSATLAAHRQQIEALRPYLPDSNIDDSLCIEYTLRNHNNARLAKYSALLFAHEYDKAKALLATMRLTADDDEDYMKFIISQTAKNHGL